MNAWGGLLAVALYVLVWPALSDWWRRRTDRVVDGRYEAVCDALRGVCEQVDVPPFRIVVPLFDQDAEGAA